jgi:hypothetical protein
VLPRLEMYLLVKTDGGTARGVSLALQQEQIVIFPESGECEDLAPGHLLLRRFVSPPVDEDGNFHVLLLCLTSRTLVLQ